MNQPPEYKVRVSVSHDATHFKNARDFHDKLRKLGLAIHKAGANRVEGMIEPDRLESLATTEGLKVRVNEQFQLDPKEWEGK